MATVTSASSGDLRTSHTDQRISGTPSLGELLKRTRESRGVTLERIARETRIPQRHLEALEHHGLTASTADFYQRAEIRAYARAVGLDQEVLRVAMIPVDASKPWREPAKSQGPTASRTYALIAFAVVALMAAAALGRALSQPAAPQGPGVGSGATSPGVPAPASSSSPGVGGLAPGALAQSPVGPDAAAQDTTASETPTPAISGTELVVTAQPEGARVTVNGVGWGLTPLTIRHMPAGEKRIRVSKDGYVAQERVIRLGQGRSQTLDVQLDSAP